MQIDEQRKEQILGVFKTVYEYRTMSKENNATATENMNGLVESLTADKGEQKVLKKAMNKAYKEWVEEIEGTEDSLSDAIEILEAIRIKEA